MALFKSRPKILNTDFVQYVVNNGDDAQLLTHQIFY